MENIKAWLNEQIATGEGDKTNGDFLRTFLVNFAKAIIALLDTVGAWPIVDA